MLKNNIAKGIAVMTTVAGLLTIALALPSFTVLGASQKQAGSDDGAVHSPRNTEAEAEAAADYWTPERMASAAPYPMDKTGSDSQTRIQPAPAGGSLGAPGLIDGNAAGQ
jgi:hypothetical protein